MPIISVIIPTFNRSALLKRAVLSALGQSFRDIEVIVVDDCSTDDTASMLKSIDGGRIVYLRNEKNEGAQFSRLKGVISAKGEFVAFLDSDDEWYPDKLEKQVSMFRKLPEKTGVVHGGCDVLFESTGEKKEYPIPKLTGGVYRELLQEAGPMYPCLMVRKRCFDEIPDAIDTRVPSFQEWDTSINLARKYDFHFIDEPLMIYHRHGGETISYNLKREVEGYLYIIEKHRDEIISQCGRAAMGAHYMTLAAKCRYLLGDEARTREFYEKAREYGARSVSMAAYVMSPALAGKLEAIHKFIRRGL